MKLGRKGLAWGCRVLTLVMLMGLLSVGAYGAGSSYTDLQGVVWSCDEEGVLSMIQDSGQTIEQAQALLISATADGKPVKAVESNGFDNVVVGHKANEYILIAEGIESIGGKTFYDFNYVKSVSLPASVTEIDYNAFDVLGREINNATVIYGKAGSAAESWAGDNSTAVYDFQPVEGTNFSVSAGEGGSIHPAGDFYVPQGMKEEAVSTAFSVQAASGYAIESLTVDGEAVVGAAGQSAWLLDYTFHTGSQTIQVTFVRSEAASAEGEGENEGPVAVEVAAGESVEFAFSSGVKVVALAEGAVAEGVDIGDVYDAPADNAAGYAASMGVSTGDFYILDGVLYEMIFATNGTGDQGDLGMQFYCKAEVINYLYETEGWVYGEDYDLIRMYHFDSTVTGGNRKGSYDFHCAFVYKQVDGDGVYEDLTGETAFYSEKESTAGITNNSTLLVQGSAGVITESTVTGLVADNHTRPDGPQEATNFYGIGSAVLVDGGTASMSGYATEFYTADEATTVNLTDPWIVGGANPIYVLATSRANIAGGTLFTAFSGGHGPYVSLQGQIAINADEAIIDENGVANTDVEDLKENALSAIPGRFGWAERNTYDDGTPVAANDYTVEHSRLALDEEGIAAYEAENGPVTVVTTANSSGSILVTDTGGGIVLANRLSGTAYSTGSSGIYSMGGGSYVYVYNSRLESHIEPAINSVGEGYVFAFNSRFTGPVGVLSSGGSDHVQIHNSEIATALDFDMDFYDLTDPGDEEQLATYQQLLAEVDSAELVNSNYLMIFPLNGDDMSNFVSNWFEDKTQVPGKNGGNIAVLSTTSPSGILIDSTRLYNGAYAEYGDIGAPNWLIAAAGGTSTFRFVNENSQTCWDLTGEDQGTTELYGNIYCAPSSGSGMWVTSEGSALVELENSEWTGTIENRGSGVSLVLDGTSLWTVTGTCTVKELVLAEGAEVTAPDGCDIAFYQNGAAVTLSAGTYENLQVVITRDGETVYDGLYTEESVPAAETAAPEATASEGESGASGEAAGGASGDMGGSSGEASGDMGGGMQFSTGASNCVHEESLFVTDARWSFDADGVAEFSMTDTGAVVQGLAPGETELTVELSLSDGTQQTIRTQVTVK